MKFLNLPPTLGYEIPHKNNLMNWNYFFFVIKRYIIQYNMKNKNFLIIVHVVREQKLLILKIKLDVIVNVLIEYDRYTERS